MPKSAVLFSNHFRCFPLIADKIKKFYGDDVDYYASLWDHDHDMYTKEERLDLIDNNVPFPYYIWYKGSCLPYHELDIDYAVQFLKDFGVKGYTVTNASEYDHWCNQIQGLKYNTWWDKFFRFGSLYSKYRGWKLIESTGIEYDVIYFHRFDILNFMKDRKLSSQQAIKDISFKDCSNYFHVDALSLNKGMVRVEDRFFYTSSEGCRKLFNNLTDRLNNIIDNPLFSHKAQDFFTTHKILGGLLLTADFFKIRTIPFVSSTIHKSTVEEGFDLDDFDSCEEHHYDYKDMTDTKLSGDFPYRRNKWAQNFFKEFINKYGGH